MADSVVRAVPRLGLKEGVVALELCAQHLSSKPGTVSKVHGSAAWPSRSRAGAEHSYLSGLSLGCLVQPGAALLITRLHPVHCHISTIPKNLNSALIYCPMQSLSYMIRSTASVQHMWIAYLLFP